MNVNVWEPTNRCRDQNHICIYTIQASVNLKFYLIFSYYQWVNFDKSYWIKKKTAMGIQSTYVWWFIWNSHVLNHDSDIVFLWWAARLHLPRLHWQGLHLRPPLSTVVHHLFYLSKQALRDQLHSVRHCSFIHELHPEVESITKNFSWITKQVSTGISMWYHFCGVTIFYS